MCTPETSKEGRTEKLFLEVSFWSWGGAGIARSGLLNYRSVAACGRPDPVLLAAERGCVGIPSSSAPEQGVRP